MDLPLHSFQDNKPSEYQEIIVTDGQYYRSGIWIVLPDGGHFIPDPNRPIRYTHWIPKPEIPSCEN